MTLARVEVTVPHNPFMGGLRPQVGSHSRSRSRSRQWLVTAGEWAFGLTIAICGISLVLHESSAIWRGPNLRLGVHPSLAPRLIPLVGMLIATACFVLSTGGRTFKRPLKRLLPVSVVCLLVLAVLVVGGSVYSRVIDGNPNTFFSLGFVILCGPCACWCFELTPDPARLLRVWMVALAAGTVVVLVSSLARLFFTMDGGFTEHFPVVFALAGLMWFMQPTAGIRVIIGLVVAAVCLLSFKKSGIISFGAMALPVVVDACIRRFGATQRTAAILFAMCLSVVVMNAVIFFALSTSFRSGEHLFRQYSYDIAWQQFLESPIIGQVYTGESAVWNPYYPGERVAVHNDVLDVLRQGGVVGFILFAIPMYGSWWFLWCYRKYWKQAPPGLLGGAAAVYGTTVVFLFNPTLLTPDIAAIVWTMLGCTIWHQGSFRSGIRSQETVTWLHR